MLRQAGRVSLSCAAHARQIRWPVHARPPLLHPRCSRALRTSPAAAAPAGSINLADISGDAPPALTPWTTTRESPDPDTYPLPSLPQQSQQAEEAHGTRETHRGHTAPDDPSLDRWPSAGDWTLSKDRLGFQMPWLQREARRTGQDLWRLMEEFQDWDSKLYNIWTRLEGTKTECLPNKSTRLNKLLTFQTVEEMRSWWLAIPKEKRESSWPPMMLAGMAYSPERAAQVLEATLEPTVPPSWAVADVFDFLAKWSSTLPHDRRREQQAALSGLLLHILRRSRPRDAQLRQRALGEILPACEPGSAVELWKALRQSEHPLRLNTKFQLATLVAKNEKGRLVALQLLEEILKSGEVDANDRRCAALASTLFTLPRTWDSGRGSPVEAQLVAEAFERIVGLGLSPNVITYTAMIRTLCLTNQLNTAWKVYDVMRNQGTEMDPHVFSILLNGAKRAGCLDSTIRVIEDASAETFRTPLVWNDIIDTILRAATDETKARSREGPAAAVPAFYSMLLVYAKFFKLEPLQRLLPLDLGKHLAEGDRDSRPEDWQWKAKLALLIDELPAFQLDQLAEPGVDSLGLMLIGYVRSFSAAYPVMSFYSHFRNLLKNRDPVAIALVGHNTLPYDAIIDSLTHHVGMLRVVIDITNDMLQNATNSAAALKGPAGDADQGDDVDAGGSDEATLAATARTLNPAVSTNAPFYHPPPSIYTWSILVYAFVRQSRPYRAARLLDIMRAHGVEPSRVTYNMLISGYARVQDAGAVLWALHRLREGGYHPDHYTFRGVARLADAEPALAYLETSGEEREAEYWRALKAVAGHDLSGETEVAGLGLSHDREVERRLKVEAKRARRKQEAKRELSDVWNMTEEEFRRAVMQMFRRHWRNGKRKGELGISRATGERRRRPVDARHAGRKSVGGKPTAEEVANQRRNTRGEEPWLAPRRAFQSNPGGADISTDITPADASHAGKTSAGGKPTAEESANQRSNLRGEELWLAPRRAFQSNPGVADISTDITPADNSSAAHIRPMDNVPAQDNNKPAEDNKPAQNNQYYTDSIPAEELDAYMQKYATVALRQNETNARPSATASQRRRPRRHPLLHAEAEVEGIPPPPPLEE